MQDANATDIEKQLNDVRTAQIKLKEAEKFLNEIKKKLELHAYITNEVLKKQDISIFTRLKNEYNVIPSYNELEKILLNVITILNPVKETLDKKSYLPHLRLSTFNYSKQLFHEEFSTSVRETNTFKFYKAMLSQYNYMAGGIELPYGSYQEYLGFSMNKFNCILVKYHKNTKFENLPDIFHDTIIRPDMITITLTVRKIEKTRNSEDIVIQKIVYSTLFDKKNSKHSFHKEKVNMNYLDLHFPNVQDDDMKNLIQQIRKNSHKLSLPCTYPTLYLFQYFSALILEKIEQTWKMSMVSTKSLNDRKILYDQLFQNIIKKYPEDLHYTMQQRCFVCKKLMKNETLSQRMLPCVWIRIEKTDKFAIHNACKKVIENGKEIDEPKIILTLDGTYVPEEDDISKYFN